MTMLNTFRLVYECTNCHTLTEAKTVDGVPSSPPDICLVCSCTNPDDLPYASNKRKVGDIRKGVQLDYYSKRQQEWRVLCLFCKQYAIIPNKNIGVQLSCGCLKTGSTLKVEYFYPATDAPGKVRCTCRECGLTSDYMLTDDGPIVCRSGCVKEVVR